jgi:putative Holliday junction resolvase
MSERVVAFDLGDRRIGVAVSDPGGTIALGRDTLERSGESLPWRAIGAVLEEEGAARIVVGDPIHLDGSVGERARLAREFAEEAARRTGLPVELQDERLTSVQARRALIDTRPGRGRKRKEREDVDRVAAVLILQAWLDRVGTGGDRP